MTPRYANDLALTHLARCVTNCAADMNQLLNDGRLDSAWIVAHQLSNRVEQLKERLNRLKYDEA